MYSFKPLNLDTTTSDSANHTNEYYSAGDNGDHIFAKLHMDVRPRSIETHHSLDERSLSDIISSGLSSPRPPRQLETVKSSECLEALLSPSIRSSAGTPREYHAFEPHPMIADAWDALRKSMVYFRSKPVGTIAALDPTEDSLNYNQVGVFNCLILFCTRLDKTCEVVPLYSQSQQSLYFIIIICDPLYEEVECQYS